MGTTFSTTEKKEKKSAFAISFSKHNQNESKIVQKTDSLELIIIFRHDFWPDF